MIGRCVIGVPMGEIEPLYKLGIAAVPHGATVPQRRALRVFRRHYAWFASFAAVPHVRSLALIQPPWWARFSVQWMRRHGALSPAFVCRDIEEALLMLRNECASD